MKILKPASTLFSAALLTLLSACAATSEQPAEPAAETAAAPQPVNDFPTQDRVEYVLECIAKKQGSLKDVRYETLYPCICRVDKIAEKMKYNEFAEAKTINFMRKTPGEQGGIFRDPPRAKQLRDQLKSAEKYAEESCVVKRP